MVSVADLVTKLHSNIDQIHQTIASISNTSDHDAEIKRLENERDEQLQKLKIAHETATKEGEEARLKEEKEFEEQIKKDEEEIAERRRREDEERKLRIENALKEREKVKQEEEEKMRVEFETKHRAVEDGVDGEIEKLEDELEKQMMHGQKALEDLDAARREINRQIDEQLNVPTVLPKIQYKSRKKTVLNRRQPDSSVQNQNIKGLEEDGRNNPDKNESSICYVNEKKIEEPQDYGAIVANSERGHGIEPVKGMEVPASPPVEEVVHQNQETQTPKVEYVEEISQPIEETPVSKSEESQLEPEEARHRDQEHRPKNTAQEHQNLPEPETAQSVKDLPREINDFSEALPTETLSTSEDTPKDQAEDNQPAEVTKAKPRDDSKQDNPSEELASFNDYAEESQTVDGEPKRDKTRIEIPNEFETPAHDLNESPEDRAAREEIAKLNEEIRRAMEEEAAEAMIPHEGAKDLSHDAREEDPTITEAPRVQEFITTQEPANEAFVENKGLTEEDMLPQIESIPNYEVSEVPVENGDSELKATPDLFNVENVSQNGAVSKRNESEDEAILEPEESASGMTQDTVQTTPEMTLPTEGPSSEQTLHVDPSAENNEPPKNETVPVDESSDPTENKETEEMPVTLRDKVMLPAISVEEPTRYDVHDENVEMADESLSKLSPNSHNLQETDKILREPETIYDDQKSTRQDDSTTLEQFEAEEIRTVLPEPTEVEVAQLNEEPSLQSNHFSKYQSETDQSQEKIVERAITEDKNAEGVPTFTENPDSVNENTPKSTGENSTAVDLSNSNVSENEGEAKVEEVVPDQVPIEKESGVDSTRNLKAEDDENLNSIYIGGSSGASQVILHEAGENKGIPEETFKHSELALELVQSDLKSHEDQEDHVLPTGSQPTTGDHEVINEFAVPTQEEPYSKDADIEILANRAPIKDSNHKSDPPKTRDIISSDIHQEAELAVGTVVTITDKIHDAQNDTRITSNSGEVETRELDVSTNEIAPKDEDSVGEQALDSNSEEIQQNIDEPLQLQAQIKHHIKGPIPAIQQVNNDLEERTASPEKSISDTESNDLQATDENVEPSSDSNAEEPFSNAEKIDAPGLQDFEGIVGAFLTLDVGSPLPSPTHQKNAVNDGAVPQLEPDIFEKYADLKEMGQQEDTKVDHSASTQALDDVEPLLSSQISSEDNSLAELVKTEQSRVENDLPKHQEANELSKQAPDGILLKNQELHKNQEFFSTFVEETVQGNSDLKDAKSEEDATHPEIQNNESHKVETATSASEIYVPESPITGVFDQPIKVEDTHSELEDFKDGTNGDKDDVVSADSPFYEEGKIHRVKDAHIGELSEINHVKCSEKTDIPSIPNASAIPEYIQQDTEGTESSTGNEEKHINTVSEVKIACQDATVQSQQIPHEDPQDVSAREEIARLNEEFMKALEEEQADEEAKESVDLSTKKDIGDVKGNEHLEEEQQRPNSLQNVEDAATMEEIALLNEQTKLFSQQEESGNKPAEIEGAKEESHEVTNDCEPRKLASEWKLVELEHAKSESHQSEDDTKEQVLSAISNPSIQQDEGLNTSNQADKTSTEEEEEENSQPTTDEASEDTESSQHLHESHDSQDSDSESERMEESENEWDGSVGDEEEPLLYLETIHEESHDGNVSHTTDDHEEDDEDEEMPKSRFFHPPWKSEDMDDDEHPTEKNTSASFETQDNNSGSLHSERITAFDSSHDLQDDQDQVKPSVLPLIDRSEVDQHPSDINLEALKPRSSKRPQTPMQLVPNQPDIRGMVSPRTFDGTDQSFYDEDLEATTETPSHFDGMDLPRLLEPSTVVKELNSTPEKAEGVEQNFLGKNNNLASESGPPRHPTSLYHRTSDLSPEHEAVFSRVSQIRSGLTLSPESQYTSHGSLSPRSRSERLSPDEHRNYLDASINNAYDGSGYSNESDDDQPNDYQTYLNTDGRNRSHTVDTVPSFEHYASDDGDSGPPTPPQQPRYSDLTSQQQPHIGQMLAQEFESSERWSLQNDDAPDDSANREEDREDVIKSPIAQEAAEFDTFNPQEYKSPIPSPVKSSFNSSNAHVDQNYLPTSLSNTLSLLPPEKILGSNAPASNSIFASPTPSASTQVEKTPTSQLPPNLYLVPWTQSEDPHKVTNQAKETASPQSNTRPVSSIFARTRSLFESTGTNDTSPTSKQRPLSGMSIFNVSQASRSTPSPTSIQTRPPSRSISSLRSASGSKISSLHLSENVSANADYDPNTDADFLPRCLDGDGRLPSPAYGLPGHRSSGSFDKGRGLLGDGNDPYYTQKGSRASGNWVSGLTSMKSRGAVAEGEPLLRDGN